MCLFFCQIKMSPAVTPAPPVSSPSPVPGSCSSMPRTPMASASIWRANLAAPSLPAWLQLLGWGVTVPPPSLPSTLFTWLMAVLTASWGCQVLALAGIQHPHLVRAVTLERHHCSARHHATTSAQMTWLWQPTIPAPLTGWWGSTQCQWKPLRPWTSLDVYVSWLGMPLGLPRLSPLTGPALCNGWCSHSSLVLSLHFPLRLPSPPLSHLLARAPPPILYPMRSNQAHLSRQSLASSAGRPSSSRAT